MELKNIHAVESAFASIFANAVMAFDHPTALAALTNALGKIWVGLIMSLSRTHLDLFEGLLGDVSTKSRQAHRISFDEQMPVENKLWLMSNLLLASDEIDSAARLDLCSMLLAQRLGIDYQNFDPDSFDDTEAASSYLQSLEVLRGLAADE